MKFKSGNKYDGEWTNNSMHGQGVFTGVSKACDWVLFFGISSEISLSDLHSLLPHLYLPSGVDGHRYKGGFMKSTLHGEGVYEHADGRRYEGGFVQNYRHGNGTQKYSDGCVRGRHRAGQGGGRGEGVLYCCIAHRTFSAGLSTWEVRFLYRRQFGGMRLAADTATFFGHALDRVAQGQPPRQGQVCASRPGRALYLRRVVGCEFCGG